MDPEAKAQELIEASAVTGKMKRTKHSPELHRALFDVAQDYVDVNNGLEFYGTHRYLGPWRVKLTIPREG